ncbi:hypothetical protein PPERSA_04938 [Pseudocohnilembus persalinus]|uniref:Uncharacterized protein n=1 Tax=Pseudocohnilembus persalinus TaxID=266149 RepID=A0A0V0QVV1_PSEPJ|nr:hypothetical protein PPERSA_04938 [Pseudocohnilembus persalinus]|eukprot:KRX06326.1 hypothetical protein PPERSA_04938 [Pseudocohnilembus persalinus]
MQERKFMDQRRWFCISRPQYPRSCGISSLISCFNYLFSNLGVGNLPPISAEEAIEKLKIVKSDKAYKDVEFGAFTGNDTLINWWKRLLKIYKLEGTSYIFYKERGISRTSHRNSTQALEDLKKGLKSENMAFIYHSYDHYMCPIGFEITPGKATDAYVPLEKLDPVNVENWIIVGETARNYPCFHTRKWQDIAMDIGLDGNKTYNIREPQKGVMNKESKSTGNSHCIIAFTKKVDRKNQILPNQINNHKPIIQQPCFSENFDQQEQNDEDLDQQISEKQNQSYNLLQKSLDSENSQQFKQFLKFNY